MAPRREILSTLLMLLFLILGLVGETAFKAVASRLESFEAAGIKFSLRQEETTPEDGAASARTGKSDDTPRTIPPSLYYVTATARIVGVDIGFFELISGNKRDSRMAFKQTLKDSGLSRLARFYNSIFGAVGECVIIAATVDIDSKGAAVMLKPIGATLFRLSVLGERASSTKLAYEELRRNVDMLHGQLDRQLKWMLTSDEGISRLKSLKISVASREACLDWLNKYVPATKDSKPVGVNLPSGWNERPYLVMAHAGLQALQENYRASLESLRNWLKDHEARKNAIREMRATKPSQKAAMQKLHKVYEIRIRGVITAYLEEWLRRLEPARNARLEHYHLENLQKLTSLLWSEPSIATVFGNLGRVKSTVINSRYEIDPDFRVMCNSGKKPAHIQGIYVRSWIVNWLLYADRSIRDRQFTKKQIGYIRDGLQTILRADLTCLKRTDGDHFPIVNRAEALNLVAKVELAYVAALEKVLSDGDKKNRLDIAKAAVLSGLRIIATIRPRQAPSNKLKSFAEDTSPDEIESARTSLDKRLMHIDRAASK